MNEEIKQELLLRLDAAPAAWSTACADVARKLDVNQAYVEKAMGELVREGKIAREQNARGLPKYAVLNGSPGAVEGKYRPFTERRLDAEAPSKSGTFEDNPWRRDINGPTAV